jgi:very-short-patch-repair endonuclease
MRKPKYNSEEIQKDLDCGFTIIQLSKKHKISHCFISKLIKIGILKKTIIHKNGWDCGYTFPIETIEKLRKTSTGKKHSEETKKKISDHRIKWLTEHPDKVPYLINHSSKKSFPEEVFENALKSAGIEGWKYKYRHGIYEYDFAFPELKIDVEVDGGTHKTEKVKKIDERRDRFSNQAGWKVLRFEAERVKKDVLSCINDLIDFIK